MVVGDGGCEAYTTIARGATLSLEIPDIAEAETVASVEGNMCNPAMRGTDAPPGSETTSRTKGTRRNLGDLISDRSGAGRFGPHRETAHPTSLAASALYRQRPEVGAVCGKAARTDLWGAHSNVRLNRDEGASKPERIRGDAEADVRAI